MRRALPVLGLALCMLAAAHPAPASARYRSLGALGVKASRALLSGRTLSVTIASKHTAKLRLEVVRGTTVGASGKSLTVKKGKRTVVAHLDRTPVGGGLKLRITATRGARKGRGTITLSVQTGPVMPPPPPAPPPAPPPPAPPPPPNLAPTDISLSSTSVMEGPSAATVGTLSATDPNAGDTFTFSLVPGAGSTDNASFDIAGSTLKTTVAFGFPTPAKSVRVRVTDGHGATFEKQFSISVAKLNLAPTNIALSGSSIAENQASGTTAGTLSGTDPDAGDVLSFSLVPGTGSSDNGSFSITGTALKTSAPLDFEAGATRSVRVRVTDSQGASFEKVFVIGVTDVNEAPTDIALTHASVAENLPGATAVGTLASVDPDAGGTHAYLLVAGPGATDNASFQISGSTLQTSVPLDFEAGATRSIRVRSTDNGGLTFEKLLTITVTDVNDAPVAGDDTFTGVSRAVGNTSLVGNDPRDVAPDPAGPQKTVNGSILANDNDQDGAGSLAVVAGTFATNDGGSVELQADGDFVFHPKARTSCGDHSDFFDYTLTDQNTTKPPGTPASDVGRVTIDIQDCVWYVNAAAAAGGSGRSDLPFNSLSGVNGPGGAGDADGSGDKIFLYAGTYTGGLPLETTQTLLGQRNGLSVPDGGAGSVVLEPAGGANSQIDGGLTLAADNAIQGIHLGAAAGFALSGSSVGTATIDTVTSGAINNPSGGGVSINGGTLNASFGAPGGVTSGGGTNGIALTNVGGTFDAAGGTIGNASGADVALSGGTANFTYGGAISDDLGQLVAISGQTSGTKDFNGAITDLNNGTGNGITLTANGGATVRFDGGLTLSTGASPAFAATGGGNVAVTDPAGAANNTIATTTGTALNVAATTIDPSNVTFERISSNGAANGIVLNATGASGRLALTGNGGTCTAADQSGCSGGEIRNSTGADNSGTTPGGTGIVLKDTANPSLTRVWIHDDSNYAIRGTNVAGFTMDSSVINGVNGNNGTTPVDDSSVWFDNLTGSAAVSNSAVSGGYEDNVRVHNATGSLDRITFTADTIGLNSTAGGNDAVSLETDATAGALKATIQNSTFIGAGGDLVDYSHNGSGAGDLVLSSNAFSNSHPQIATGGGGLTLINNGTSGPTTMSITGNTFRGAVGPGVLVVKTTGPSTQTGTISNNAIGVAGLANSGSAEGSALKLQSVGQGQSKWTVTNNQIRGYNNHGIEVEAGGSATAQGGALSTTITGNTLTQPGNTAGTLSIAKQGVHLNIGTVPGDTYLACAAISGNDLATSGADSTPSTINVDVRLRQRQSTTIRLPGYTGSPTDILAVQAFVAASNPGGTAVLAGTSSPPGGGFTGGAPATCP